MSRHVISKKETKELNSRFHEIGVDAPFISDNQIELEEKKGKKVYFIKKIPIAVEAPSFYPTVELLEAIKPDFRNITIDDGAVPRILGGARLFAQGIVNMDNAIKKSDMVFIRDMSGKYIAIGISLSDAEKIMSDKKGPAVDIFLRGGQDYLQ
ncbi:MAG: DUF1947 domain-containing protein [Thermoplasmataceae archaeon]